MHDPRSRLAGGAYWAMMRRIVLIAGTIDALWIPFYAALGAHALAAINVLSVAMYVAAHALILRRRNSAAVSLIWAEVLTHSAAGSLLISWDSGFHYFLLIFIPAIVVGTRRALALPLVVLLLAFYLGLEALCTHLGPLSPLPPLQLQVARWVNIALVFGIFASMAGYYRATVIKAERKLLDLASTDGLTRLPNRSQFQARTAAELELHRRTGQPLALLLADVDFFKRINDEFGHEAGDCVLVQLAAVLRQTLRQPDVLARWGGEEFIMLLPASDEDAAAVVAERVRRAVAATSIELGERRVRVTLSLGVTAFTATDDLRTATLRADQALYASKHAGRNRVSRLSAAPPAGPAAAAAAPA